MRVKFILFSIAFLFQAIDAFGRCRGYELIGGYLAMSGSQAEKIEEQLCQLGCYGFCKKIDMDAKHPPESRDMVLRCQKGEEDACRKYAEKSGLIKEKEWMLFVCFEIGGQPCIRVLSQKLGDLTKVKNLRKSELDPASIAAAKLACRDQLDNACEIWKAAWGDPINEELRESRNRCDKRDFEGCRRAANLLFNLNRTEEAFELLYKACANEDSPSACDKLEHMILHGDRNIPVDGGKIRLKLELICKEFPISAACFGIGRSLVQKNNPQGETMLSKVCHSDKLNLSISSCFEMTPEIRRKGDKKQLEGHIKHLCDKILKKKKTEAIFPQFQDEKGCKTWFQNQGGVEVAKTPEPNPFEVQGLPKELVSQVVQRHHSEVRMCHQAALSRNSKVAGKVSVTFSVAMTGKVSAAAVENSTVQDPQLEACLISRIKTWVFPKPSGEATIKNYLFTFNDAKGS